MRRAACVLVAICAPLFVSCSFNSDRLDRRQCGPGAGCLDPDEVCCAGFCVLAATCTDASLPVDTSNPKPDVGPDFDPIKDRDFDGHDNDKDNCPDDYNPDQADSDDDTVGNVCDCDPVDKAFSVAVIDIRKFQAPVAFTPVDTASWRLLGTFYQQPDKDGIQRSAFSSLRPHRSFSATATFRFAAAGDDGLSDPPDNVSLAGIAVRTAGVGPGKGDGYYCAVDLASWRLMIGKTKGAEIGSGKLTLFKEATATKPGKALNHPLYVDTPYTVTLRAVGADLKCTLVMPDQSRFDYFVSDVDLSTGQVALFTVGASANFTAVKVCAAK